jgi:demethylmenaquinone methyltransferase/2-methoxy-6-polyprenyl-1,4-benzoquinol methylase
MSESKKNFIRGMFDDIHGKYDFLNTVLSFGQDRRWRRKALQDITGDCLVVDLGAGGGELARSLLRKTSFRGLVALTDISRRMLALAEKILKPEYGGRYFIVVCDAELLPFKDGVFGAAISAFCLRNLSDLNKFTSEVRRSVGRDGIGRFLEIAHPPNSLLAAIFQLYFYRLSPLIARVFTSKGYAYKYLPNSLRIFPRQEKVLESLARGWEGASYDNILGGIAAIYKLKKGRE